MSVGAGGADPISLSEKLLHNVYIGDEDDGPGVESLTPDWELTTYAGMRRYLSVTLLKATPMPGVTVWWSRVFESGKEDIDVVRAGGGGGGAKMKEVRTGMMSTRAKGGGCSANRAKRNIFPAAGLGRGAPDVQGKGGRFREESRAEERRGEESRGERRRDET